ncbi:peptidase M23-like protein [Flavobacterium croceum DSM 17960]|uniref:Peptidase M23-like protein n=1 Tax=Flavobacterium croceum DSM 17960 TaxID=1121886 RepID=A0A2S4N5D5_9FLAO|nr:M23 family metallopeptidase [Flavobacterium croceum]POS00937.1 peptidase M23-like protein [Flavobacterium croceum DSM 17960]
MRTIATFLCCLVFNHFFSQVSTEESKMRKILSLCKTEQELKIIFELKTDFPSVFSSVPTINPINPVNNPRISSSFSSKRIHPIYGNERAHNGIDITGALNTPVYATADGTVTNARFFNGNAGHSVTISHKFGFVTKYFHLSIFIVEPGEKVTKGQIIGYLGNSGSSTAPHLHYEMWKNGKVLNPFGLF